MVTLQTRPLATGQEQQPADPRVSFPFRSCLMALNDGPISYLEVGPRGTYEMREDAHGQLARHLGIPYPYYHHLKESMPWLLACNVNALLCRRPPREVCTLRLDHAGYVCGLTFQCPGDGE